MPSALFLAIGDSFSSSRRDTASVRATQQRGKVDGPCRGHQRIDEIAANAAGDGREGMRNVLCFAPAEGEQVAEERDRIGIGPTLSERTPVGPYPGRRSQVVPYLPEARLAAVREDRVDRQHVVTHDAVADRARAAGVVSGHTADRCPAGG